MVNHSTTQATQLWSLYLKQLKAEAEKWHSHICIHDKKGSKRNDRWKNGPATCDDRHWDSQSLTREGKLILRYKKEPRRHWAKWNTLATHTKYRTIPYICLSRVATLRKTQGGPNGGHEVMQGRKMGTRWIRTSSNPASSKSSRDLFYARHFWTVSLKWARPQWEWRLKTKTNTLHGVVLLFIYKLYSFGMKNKLWYARDWMKTS